VVVILITVVALVIAFFLAIAWLVGVLGRSKAASPGGHTLEAGEPEPRPLPDASPGPNRPPARPRAQGRNGGEKRR
jgi:hypothetical protein